MKKHSGMMNYSETTPLAALTIGEFKSLLEGCLDKAANAASSGQMKTSGNYVYGLRGIQQLFGVSHKTAQDYKDGIIKDAVMQNGRKIVVDADLALELFNQRRAK